MFLEIIDAGGIDGEQVVSPFQSVITDSPTYFVGQYFLQYVPEDLIEGIVGLQRGVVRHE